MYDIVNQLCLVFPKTYFRSKKNFAQYPTVRATIRLTSKEKVKKFFNRNWIPTFSTEVRIASTKYFRNSIVVNLSEVSLLLNTINLSKKYVSNSNCNDGTRECWHVIWRCRTV